MNATSKKITQLAHDALEGKKLSDDEIRQLAASLLAQTNELKPKKREFGQFAGKIQISEDFDAELSDEFWTGQAE